MGQDVACSCSLVPLLVADPVHKNRTGMILNHWCFWILFNFNNINITSSMKILKREIEIIWGQFSKTRNLTFWWNWSPNLFDTFCIKSHSQHTRTHFEKWHLSLLSLGIFVEGQRYFKRFDWSNIHTHIHSTTHKCS